MCAIKISWLLPFLSMLCMETASAFQTPLLPKIARASVTQIFRKSDSKWDNLVDEDDEEDLIQARPDMKYIPRNVQRQHQNFNALRDVGGPEVTFDLYVPEPDSEIFWFVGKVASISDVPIEKAVARQWAMIEEHASNLRPIELYPNRGKLEIWMAPGDSELDVAYNRPDVVFQKMEKKVEGAEAVKSNMVGFQGEVYEKGQGMGFRTWRTPDGKPAKPEIETPEMPGAPQAVGEDPIEYSDPRFRAPTEIELEKLQNAIKDGGMDIGQLYEEQQKKEAEESNQ